MMKKFVWFISIVLMAGLIGMVDAQAPSQNLVLHLDADSGNLVTSGSNLYTWLDKSGNSLDFHWDPDYSNGYAQATTDTFPSGTMPTVQFNGNARYEFDPNDDREYMLDAQELMVFIVSGDWGEATGGGVMFINYSPGPECGVNISRSSNGANTYFWSGSIALAGSRAWSEAAPVGKNILTLTYSNAAETKHIYFNGQKNEAHFDMLTGLDYGGGAVTHAALGSLLHLDFLNNNIAELLLYDTVDEQLRGQVEAYLSEKYGIAVMPAPPECDINTPVLWLDAGLGVTTITGMDPNVVSWADQSGGGNDAVWSAIYSADPNNAYAHLTTATFPKGDFPVIRFYGGNSYLLTNADWLDLDEMMIFAVIGPYGDGEGTGSFLVNYDDYPERGLVLQKAGNGDITRLFTKSYYGPADEAFSVSTSDYKIVSVIYSESKSYSNMFYNAVRSLADPNGLPINNGEPAGGIDYGSAIASVGGLPPGAATHYIGNIAELIVYCDVQYSKRREVEQYLYNKYIADGPLPPPQCGDWGIDGSDVDLDCRIDWGDFVWIATNWLKCTEPGLPGCVDCSVPGTPGCN